MIGLIFGTHGSLHVEAYSNAMYARYKVDYKLTIGLCTYISGNLVTWHSPKAKLNVVPCLRQLTR